MSCPYCKETRFFSKTKDYWKCGTPVGATRQYQKSFRCAEKEVKLLQDEIERLEALIKPGSG